MRIHIVQKGETLWTIAKKYGVNFEELKKMNAQLSNPEMIMPGMKIRVPAAGHKEMPMHGQQAQHHHKPPVHHHPKEAPIHHAPPHKEMPKPPVVHKEIIKEKPIIHKEQVKHIYTPVMPQLPTPNLPEIDVNNFVTMNMQQVQTQTQAPPPMPAPPPVVEEETVEMPMMPIMPIQEGCVQPMFTHPCPPPVMPICDPCYPHPHHMMPHHMPHHMMGMSPQVMGMEQWMPPVQPMPFQGMPMQQMPYQTMPMQQGAYPMAPAQGVGQPYWGDESSSSYYQMGGHHHHMMQGHDPSAVMGAQQSPYAGQGAAVLPQVPPTGMPLSGCGCGGGGGHTHHQAGGQFPMHQGMMYSMPRIQPEYSQPAPQSYYGGIPYGYPLPGTGQMYGMPQFAGYEDEDE